LTIGLTSIVECSNRAAGSGLGFILLLNLTQDFLMKQLELGHHERPPYTFRHEMWENRSIDRHGHQMVDESQRGMETARLVSAKFKRVVVLHRLTPMGAEPSFTFTRIGCPSIVALFATGRGVKMGQSGLPFPFWNNTTGPVRVPHPFAFFARGWERCRRRQPLSSADDAIIVPWPTT